MLPAQGTPYLSDVGVISFVPNVWGEVWTARHHVLTRFSKYFHVVWVNPVPEWRAIWSERSRKRPVYAAQESPATSFVVDDSGKAWPRIYRPQFLATFTERQRLKKPQRILQKRGCDKIILYIWRPEYSSCLDRVRHHLSCYHIDDDYSFSEIEQSIDDAEKNLIARVDQVIIHSETLFRKKGGINHNTIHVPNGVDYTAYAKQCDEPEDMKAIPHPRIGYVGVIKTQLDFPLAAALARLHRDWSFVFVGPRGNLRGSERLVQELETMPNVFFLGNRPVESLPSYTQSMDVCTLWYVMNDYTKYIYPLKLHEYLASGRPVVGSPIPSLQEFEHVVRLARTTEEWSRALQSLIHDGDSSPEQVAARRNVAREYDWKLLTDKIARAMCQRLGNGYLGRFERIPREYGYGIS